MMYIPLILLRIAPPTKEEIVLCELSGVLIIAGNNKHLC